MVSCTAIYGYEVRPHTGAGLRDMVHFLQGLVDLFPFREGASLWVRKRLELCNIVSEVSAHRR
jgi:hypothetical protein